ncbi:MAG: alanine-tRNA synthetase second additional domain-containing protein [Oscillospiraceae bacterium]|jgi:hypothetical protein|nr:alanine-tRNA synthetase second additional domain-containing protein [Oscillospiraceae bacterium]
MIELQSSHIISTYFAPRGRKRMYALGTKLVQLYLSPFDRLIGIIGEAGSGKSALIQGMFPGLDLTNDDDGVYVRPLPLLEQDDQRGFFTPHTYHVDIRFENGFTQMSVLADAITQALHRGKRVVVEHFDLVYPLLQVKADLLIGVGEEIVITRPNIFGPKPKEIYEVVYKSLPFRLMAHTAEDLCEFCMPPEELDRCGHGDVKHGFVITFPDDHEPAFDIRELEEKVYALIDQKLPVDYLDEKHITIGGESHPCTGPRIHVSNTGLIKDFHLLYHFIHDPFNKKYLLVGCVGKENLERLRKLEAKIEAQMV